MIKLYYITLIFTIIFGTLSTIGGFGTLINIDADEEMSNKFKRYFILFLSITLVNIVIMILCNPNI